MGFTEQEYEQLKRNQQSAAGVPGDRQVAKASGDALRGYVPPAVCHFNSYVKPVRGPNKWEAQFAEELELWKTTGHILWYQFEAWRFRLADGAYYKPDFAAIQSNGEPICYEVKGHWREAARLRIKVAAGQHPLYFIAVTKEKRTGRWQYETFGAARDRLLGVKEGK